MKFANPDWRVNSPGPLADGVWQAFGAWARSVAAQTRVEGKRLVSQRKHQDVLESFKWRFSNGTSSRSASPDEADADLHGFLHIVKVNAPLFIETWVNACIDLKRQGLQVPTIVDVNRFLSGFRVGYQIDGDVLVEADKLSEDDTRDLESLADETSAPIVSPKPTGGLARPVLRVFLCHSSRDKEAVKDLYTRLKDHGYDPWLDVMNLLPGQHWRATIEDAVRNSHVVVVCLSKGSVSTEGFVQKEIRFALDVADEQPDERIYIIPARLEDVVVPRRLQPWQWVNLYEDDGFDKLLRALVTRASGLQ